MTVDVAQVHKAVYLRMLAWQYKQRWCQDINIHTRYTKQNSVKCADTRIDMVWLVRVHLAMLLLCPVSVLSVEMLGEPFTVLTTVNGVVQTNERLLVRCSGASPFSTLSAVIQSSDPSVDALNVTIACSPATLTYSRSLVGWLPPQTAMFVGEACTRFDEAVAGSGDLDATQTQRRHLRSVGTSAVMDRRPGSGRRFVTGAIAIGLATTALVKSTQNSARLDKMAADLGSAMDNVTGMMAKMFADSNNVTNSLREDVSRNNDLIKNIEEQATKDRELLDNVTNTALRLSEALSDTNRESARKFEETDAALIAMANRQGALADSVASLASNVSIEIDTLYQSLSNLANDSTVALGSLARSTSLDTRRIQAKLVSLTRVVGMQGRAIESARTERRARSAISGIFTSHAAAAEERGLRMFADVQPVAPLPGADRRVILLERVYVTFSGHLTMLSQPVSLGTPAAVFTVSVHTRAKYISDQVGADTRWDDLLASLGSGCDDGCDVDSLSEQEVAACTDRCDLWITVEEAACGLGAGSTLTDEWFGRPDISDVNEASCLPTTMTPPRLVEVVTSFDAWVNARRRFCVGGSPGGDVWAVSYTQGRMYNLTSSLSPSNCATMGMIEVASEANSRGLTFDFAFLFLLTAVINAHLGNAIYLDRTVSGVLPSGVSTTVQELSTLPDGGSGRCVFTSCIAIPIDEPWVPVFRYTRIGVSAGVDVTAVNAVSGAAFPLDGATSELTQFNEISIASADLYPQHFIGVGLQGSYLDILGGGYAYNVPRSELAVGSARAREGTAMYMFQPNETNHTVLGWDTLNGDIFNHNAAGVSIQRDQVGTRYTPLPGGGGKYECIPGNRAGETINTEPDLCDMMSDGGWTESGSSLDARAGNVEVQFSPISSTFVTTVEVPTGPLVIEGSTRCPEIQTDFLYGGVGVRVTLYNRFPGVIDAELSMSSGCDAPRGVMVPGHGATTLTASSCADDVVVSVGGQSCGTTDIASLREQSIETVATFSGTADAAYVRTAVATVTDGVVLAASKSSVESTRIMSELVFELMNAVAETALVRIPNRTVDRLTGLVDQLSNVAKDAFDAADNITKTPGFYTNTTDLNNSVDALRAAAEANKAAAAAAAAAFKAKQYEFDAGMNETIRLQEVLVQTQEAVIEAMRVRDAMLLDIFGAIAEGGDGAAVLNAFFNGMADAAGAVGAELKEGLAAIGNGVIALANIVAGPFNKMAEALGATGMIIVIIAGSVAGICLIAFVIIKLNACSKSTAEKKADKKMKRLERKLNELRASIFGGNPRKEKMSDSDVDSDDDDDEDTSGSGGPGKSVPMAKILPTGLARRSTTEGPSPAYRRTSAPVGPGGSFDEVNPLLGR